MARPTSSNVAAAAARGHLKTGETEETAAMEAIGAVVCPVRA
jgi:hypothetical protein